MKKGVVGGATYSQVEAIRREDHQESRGLSILVYLLEILEFLGLLFRGFDSRSQLRQEFALKNRLCHFHEVPPGPRFELEGLNHRMEC